MTSSDVEYCEQCRAPWVSGNDYVLGLEALTHHLFFHPFSEKIITDFASRLTDYKTGKRSLQIPLGWELDAELLRDILSARIAEVS